MVTIIRVEHQNGLGMFRYKGGGRGELNQNIILGDMYFRHGSSFPTPYKENLDIELGGMKWFCAFKSLDQFEKWVTRGEARELINNGFKILMLKTNQYQVGKYQIIYTKEGVVETTDISPLFMKEGDVSKEIVHLDK